MKTSHLVAAGVVVGALILIAKSRKSGVAGMGDDMLVPPPGRTLTASGQVLGGLGLETRFIDSYDANPSQYDRTPQNDFVPGINGFGRSISRSVSNVGRSVAKVTAAPSNIIKKTGVLKTISKIEPVSWMALQMANTAKVVGRTISNPAAGFKMAGKGLKSFTITPLKQSGMVLGIIKPPKQTVAAGEIEYQDANGKVISKADYDKLSAAAKASVPVKATDYKGYGIWTIAKPEGGTLYLINYRSEDNSTEGAYDTMAAAQAAIDAVVVPDGPVWQADKKGAPPMQPPASTYDQAKQAYDVMAAAREQASMSQASSDTGYGTTSSDTGYGQTQQVTEEGAPKLPEQITQVQTPAAQMLPPPMEAPAPAPRGDSKVGVLVGGGVLAAIAAALATR